MPDNNARNVLGQKLIVDTVEVPVTAMPSSLNVPQISCRASL